MTNSSARDAALEIIQSVLDRRQALDLALEAMPPLEPRDRGFARLLAATVLRHLGTLDHAIDGALTKPDLAPVIRNILRLALAQLHYLKTPPHAAISSAVDLAAARAPGLKGLVNAILRRHATLVFDDRPQNNLPSWLWQRWARQYGEDLAADIAQASLQEAPLDFSVKPDASGWADALEATLMPMGTLRRMTGGAVETMPGFAEGAWWVQDLSASLPVKLLGDIAGKTVFDLCAAPGGKTAQLCAAGAIVTAVDRSAPRLKRLTQNLERLQLNAIVVTTDAATWQPEEKANAILLDAPCLATGTIRRHPDLPHLKSEKDLAALTALQARLFDHALTLLKPGGVLVYCTCSLEMEEGEAQIESALSRHSGLARLPITEGELPGLEILINSHGDLRALPIYHKDQGGMDGFFAARLQFA